MTEPRLPEARVVETRLTERRHDLVHLLGVGGAYLFIACLYLSPAHLFPALAPLRLAFLGAGSMLAAVALRRVARGEPVRMAGGAGAAMVCLYIFAGLSALWAQDAGHALGFTTEAVKLVLAFVGVVGVLTTVAQVRTAMLVAALCSIVPAWGTISRYNNGIDLVEGFRGSWIGLLANPNQLAMVMAVTLPWALYMRERSRSRLLRTVLLVAMGLQAGAIVCTHSRGGALGLATAMLAAAVLAQNKLRAMGLVLVAAVALVVFAPRSFWERTGTIENYQLDASAMGRIKSWQNGFRALGDHPFLGVGAGGYADSWDRYTARNVREKAYASHNMWMQVAVELGLIGFSAFCTMFLLLVRGLWRARQHPVFGGEARALLASVAALMVCGTTGGYAFNWFFYMVLGLAGAVVTRARQTAPQQERADGVGVAVA